MKYVFLLVLLGTVMVRSACAGEVVRDSWNHYLRPYPSYPVIPTYPGEWRPYHRPFWVGRVPVGTMLFGPIYVWHPAQPAPPAN